MASYIESEECYLKKVRKFLPYITSAASLMVDMPCFSGFSTHAVVIPHDLKKLKSLVGHDKCLSRYCTAIPLLLKMLMEYSQELLDGGFADASFFKARESLNYRRDPEENDYFAFE